VLILTSKPAYKFLEDCRVEIIAKAKGIVKPQGVIKVLAEVQDCGYPAGFDSTVKVY